MKDQNKILGALFGVAIGDALGAPLEFMSAETIKQKRGTVTDMIGGGWLNVEPGEITDDTQMTIAVAEGIVEKPTDPYQAIGRHFIEWYDSRPKDIGNCCRAVIADTKQSNAKTLQDWLACSDRYDVQSGGQSAGNGALMRAIYPILYYGNDKSGFEISDNIGRMTHWHEHSRMSIRVYHEIIADIITGKLNDTASLTNLSHYMKGITKAVNFNNLQPNGYAPFALMYSVQALQSNKGFESALIEIVNNGGDADTIGAIAGGLLGAWHGFDSIPKRWIDTLDKDIVKRLNELAEIAMQV